MGTALAQVLAGQQCRVTIWDHFPEVVDDIRRNRENRRFLPGVPLHAGIASCASAAECVKNAALVIVCVPSAFAASTIAPVLPAIRDDAILLNVAKGFAPESRQVMPLMLERLARRTCVHLGGPAIATEFARGRPSFVVFASPFEEAARRVAAWFSGATFSTSVTTDVQGATLGGILKNVYAILLGSMDRLIGGARNLEAAAVTACVSEMAEIAVAHGARRETILGLAGLGDLVATGFSPDSHNRRFGQWLATGRSLRDLEADLGWLPEGVRASRAAASLARERGVCSPLCDWLVRTLDGAPPSAEGVLRALRSASGCIRPPFPDQPST